MSAATAQLGVPALSNLNFGAGIDASALQALIDAAPDTHTLDFGNGQVLTLNNVTVGSLIVTSSVPSSDFILHH